ncbi:MAG: putative lipoprotein YiaD precursor [Planctomycetota bacterium]|jgi:flagellar motor protein MotB
MSLHPKVPAWFAASCCVLSCAVVGCSNGIFRRPAQAQPVSLAPPPGVAEPAAMLPPAAVTAPAALPSYADVDTRQVQTMLAASRDENQLLKDEIAALREQLASTSGQLAIARGPTAAAIQSGRPAATFTAGPAMMQSTMADLAIPGVETRYDGAVVRIEVPAERLFEQGGATLLPGGNALLTQVATEIERVFPRHFVGIEGHVDTEPLALASWGSPHQLTAARAATVFDFFTSRTSLRQGQLFLVAHGANHPVVSNATAAGRQRNRRVELVIYPERIGADDTESATP